MKQILLRSSIKAVMFTDEILTGDRQNIYAVINGSYCYIKQINQSFYWYFNDSNRIASDVYGKTVQQLVEFTLNQNIATSVKYLTDEEISTIN